MASAWRRHVGTLTIVGRGHASKANTPAREIFACTDVGLRVWATRAERPEGGANDDVP